MDEQTVALTPLRPGPTLLQEVSKAEFNRRTASSFADFLKRQPFGRIRESALEAEVIRAANLYQGCRRVWLKSGDDAGAWYWQDKSRM